jgi:hypothetical protein
MGKTAKPEPTFGVELQPIPVFCSDCQQRMYADYTNQRTITTLQGLLRLTLTIRRCQTPQCSAFKRPYRPEAEGSYALPRHEFGLDVIAFIGQQRYHEHRSLPEIHAALQKRGLLISPRTVANLLDRYDELVATRLTDHRRLQKLLQRQGKVILALDGLQPDVGHEVLWVVRECLSGEVLLARSLLSARQQDLATLLQEVADALTVPIQGVVSDGQHSIRKAVAQVFPKVPHQLCHFHYLREAARPLHEADRHAKKELKKKVRGVRQLERSVEERDDPEAEVIRGYCGAVRAAITDDGQPPLSANGLVLHERLTAIDDSLGRLPEKGGCRAS